MAVPASDSGVYRITNNINGKCYVGLYKSGYKKTHLAKIYNLNRHNIAKKIRQFEQGVVQYGSAFNNWSIENDTKRDANW